MATEKVTSHLVRRVGVGIILPESVFYGMVFPEAATKYEIIGFVN